MALAALLGFLYLMLDTNRYEGSIQVEEVSEPMDVVLEAGTGTTQIFSIELFFEGRLSKDAEITIGIPGDPFYIRKRLKAGTIQTTYRGDWYYDRCPIRYEPLEAGMEGALEIWYRFNRN